MVWVYEHPLTSDERKVQRYLDKQLKKKGYTEQIVKLLTLYRYLKKHKFRSPKQIQEHFFYDKKHERPIFDDKTSKEVYRGLKQKGGSEYPYANRVIELAGSFLKRNDPTPISEIAENILWLVKQPSELVKGVVGEGPYELASLGVNGVIETGVSGVNGVATDVAGPVGFAAVGLFTGIAAAFGAALAMAQGDFAQAAVHGINFLPGIGPALLKGMTKLEKMGDKVDHYRGQIANIPLVGDTISSVVPDLDVVMNTPPAAAAAAGKRFSTRRRKIAKCPRTRRNKCVRS
jgi:hypothetical protein